MDDLGGFRPSIKEEIILESNFGKPLGRKRHQIFFKGSPPPHPRKKKV
jgi:hypothetical protein